MYLFIPQSIYICAFIMYTIYLYLSIYLSIYLSTGGSSYYTRCCGSYHNTPGIDYIECSENVSSLSQCSFDTSSLSDTCSDHYNDLYVTCRRSKSLSIYLSIYLYIYHSVYLNIFIFIFLHTVLPTCDGSLFQYQNTSYFYFANGTRVRTGRVEVCVDGTYIPVCANGLNSSLLSQSRLEELNGICKIIMSYGKLI